MTTPPTSPSLLYLGATSESKVEEFNRNESLSPPLSPMKTLSHTKPTNRLMPADQELAMLPFLKKTELESQAIIYAGEMTLYFPQARFNRQKRCYCVLTTTSLLKFKSLEKAAKVHPALKPKGKFKIGQRHQQQHNEKLLVSLEHVFAVYRIHLPSGQSAIRINHVNSEELSKPSGSLTLIPVTTDSAAMSSLITVWIKSLRSALERHLPGLVTIGPAEQFAAIERTRKQNDQISANHPTIIHKVILRTTKTNTKSISSLSSSSKVSSSASRLNLSSLSINDAVPVSALSTTSPSATVQSSYSLEQKDVYVPVIFLLGHNSLYLLPSKSEYDDYRRYVTRDRHGLLSIRSIIVDADDDTVTIDVSTTQGPSHQLRLISLVSSLLVYAIHRAIQRLVPHFHCSPYTLVCPSVSKQLPPSARTETGARPETTILPAEIVLDQPSVPVARWLWCLSQTWKQQNIALIQSTATNDTSMTSLYTRVTHQLDTVLMAYCAALNLDKRRFNYMIKRSQSQSRPTSLCQQRYQHHHQQKSARLFSIQVRPSNEVNGNFASYSKFELMAIFRSLRHIDYFESISFKNIRLAPLMNWLLTKNDSWTQHDTSSSVHFHSMLANEIFLLLSHNSQLRSLDLSGCGLGVYFCADDTVVSTTSLVRLPSTKSVVHINTLSATTRVCTSRSQQQKQQQQQQQQQQQYRLSTTSASSCQQCSVQAILLAMQTNSSVNLSSLALDGCMFHEQDINLLTQLLTTSVPPPSSPSLPLALRSSSVVPVVNLRELSLRKSHLSSAAMENVILAIIQGPSKDVMERLDLQENNGLVSTEVLTQVWQQCSKLSRLGVSCHFRPGDQLQLVQHPKTMNELDLSGSQMGDQHVLEICAWLTHEANTLRPPTETKFELRLSLVRCGLHGQHIHRLLLAVSVPHHRRLHFNLALGGNPLIKQVVHQPWLWSSLAKGSPESLSFQHISWETGSLRELFEALIQNKTVEHLDLSYGMLDKEHHPSNSSLLSPFEAKTVNTNRKALQTKRLSSSSSSFYAAIDSISAKFPQTEYKNENASMSSALLPSPISMTEVALSSTFTFDISTVLALANLLGKMTNLSSFTMDAEQREDIYTPDATSSKSIQSSKFHLTDIAQLLSSTFRYLAFNSITLFNTTLTRISVQNHGLGDAAIQSLCQWVKSCPAVQSLHIDGNLISIAGFRALLDLVKRNRSVRELPRPELDFRRELHRLEAQARQLQESESELQYLVIHMVGVDSHRARSLIEDQALAREAIMIDRSQLPILADQLDKIVQKNAASSKNMILPPYWTTNSTGDAATPSSTSPSSTSISLEASPPIQRRSSTFSSLSFPAANMTPTSSYPYSMPEISMRLSIPKSTQPELSPSPSSSSSSSSSSSIFRPLRGRPTSSSSTYSIYHELPMKILSEALPPPTCPLPPIPSTTFSQ